MGRLTVLHLITELDTGGAEQMLFKLVTHMDQERFRSVVASMTDRGDVGERIEKHGIPVISLGMSRGRPGLEGTLRLYRLLQGFRPDIVQTWMYHADLLGLIAAKIARTGRIVWGIRCSNMDFRNYRRLTNITVHVCRALSSIPDAIVVNSSKGREVHKAMGYDTKRMVVIPNGFDVGRFRPDDSARGRLIAELGIPESAVLIGLVARFDPMKDHGTFLKAASLVSAEESAARFVLIGEGMSIHNRRLGSLLDDRLRGRVHLLGVRDDMPRLTAAMDIAVSSSAYGEGFPNTIGEAMACSVPCVVTDVGDAAEILGDGGIVTPPRDPAVMSKGLLRLLRMGRERRREMGDRGRGRVKEHFDLRKMVEQFERFYEGLRQV